MSGVRVRFDDVTAPGGSFELSGVDAVFVAREPREVRAALEAAEDAARTGRWVAGFVTYEAAAGLDPGLPVSDWPTGHPMAALPLAWFGAFHSRVPCDRLPVPSSESSASSLRWTLDRTQDWHRRAVGMVKDDIAAGTYYQLNLTARLTGSLRAIEDLYAHAAAAQRSAYGALIATDEFTIASISPELFFARNGTRVLTRPMKGTAPRGRWPAEDAQWAAALRASAKERAENVMIVDLMRNDLARIARTGTVAVSSLFDAERYPTLWQLTSSVQADVGPEVSLGELFGALFPSGSVTGAPKRAAMAAIAALEGRPRGVYCGAIGYLAPDPVNPPARFSVAIRTAVCVRGSDAVEYGTGGGITWASQPEAEWAELASKTEVLRRASRPKTLLETLCYEPGIGPRHLDRHLRRLGASADYFDIPFCAASAAEEVAVALEHRAEPARVRIVLARDGRLTVEVTRFDAGANRVVLGLADEPVDSGDVMLFHKHGARRRYDAARAAQPAVDDVVLWNERDEVTETTTANLAVRLDSRWWTPALDCGLLPGVERERLLETGVLTERVVTLGEFAAADAVAVLSSLRGWRPARLSADRVTGNR